MRPDCLCFATLDGYLEAEKQLSRILRRLDPLAAKLFWVVINGAETRQEITKDMGHPFRQWRAAYLALSPRLYEAEKLLYALAEFNSPPHVVHSTPFDQRYSVQNWVQFGFRVD